MMSQSVLSQLNIYPLKSAGGISLEKTITEARGLAYDRRWMVVDDTGQFMTQRTYPKMALIITSLSTQTLILNAPGMSKLFLPLFPTEGDSQEVKIWNDLCEAWTVNPEATTWISEYIGKSCKLVYMPDRSNRPIDANYAVDEYQVAFSDGYPLLLISEASLNELNSRLPEIVTMKRFRPNLVVTNTEPYEEDSCKKIIVGECEFNVVKPCSRCILTTVDPENGKFSGKEPLRTLATYRTVNGKVMFGQNMITTIQGTLKVGMPVYFI